MIEFRGYDNELHEVVTSCSIITNYASMLSKVYPHTESIPIKSFKLLTDKYHYKNKNGNSLWANINPNTLSQFTGLHDKNGVKIFGSVEIDGKLTKGGDIVGLGSSMLKCVVCWDSEHSGFGVKYLDLEKSEFNKLRQFTKLETETHWTIIGKQFETEETV